MDAPQPCHDLALFLGGGGARASYQAGVLRSLSRCCPDLDPKRLVGVSAGAINIGHLANRSGDFADACEGLAELWSRVEFDQVFEARGLPLLRHALAVLMKLTIGWAPTVKPVRGMVDARPLAEFLAENYGGHELSGIRRNIEGGRLDAVALIALHYATGRTISFCEGEAFEGWERPMRRSVRTDLGLEHVLASAALPLFFPSVEVDGEWYGDGGVRLTAPLAPAVHLGARRILAISTRYRAAGAEADVKRFDGPPSPAQIGGNLFGAIFLDVLDQDAHILERTNRLLRNTPPRERGGLREIDLVVVRPSEDLGRIANEFEARLPGMFRFLTRRLGTAQGRSQELLSTVLFQQEYLQRLMEIGERDGEAAAEEVEALLCRTA